MIYKGIGFLAKKIKKKTIKLVIFEK